MSTPLATHFEQWSVVDDDKVLLNVLGCRLTCEGQAETNAEAWINNSLRPRKPEGSLGWTAQDGYLDSHTAAELCTKVLPLTSLYNAIPLGQTGSQT